MPISCIYYHALKNLTFAGGGPVGNLMRSCFKGAEPEKPTVEEGGVAAVEVKLEESMSVRCVKLILCAAGLMGSYLTWGMIQERIMAFEYGPADGPKERFKNSQFLVFVNRILAFALAMFVVIIKSQPRHTAPLYKYSYSSFSNIMSSWFQYEALKFVSFPTQVLAKASKVIPVMLMGKVVSKKTYEYYEYLTAVMISVGIFTFIITSPDSVDKGSKVTTFSGIVCLVGYLLFDSFTSNWQGELFRSYKVSSFQMMAGVNLFSVLLTSTTLLEQGGFIECVAFMGRHSEFLMHVVILSLCSAVGQVVIFYTIQEFGAVTFTIIMTLRQGFAILLSCIYYHHPVTALGILGVFLVFLAIFIRIYCGQRIKKMKAAAKASSSTVTTA